MTVTGVDKDAAKIEAPSSAARSRSTSPVSKRLVAKNVKAGRLPFTTDLAPAIREAAACSSPSARRRVPDGAADLSFVRQVAESIGDNLNGYKVVVTKSTVPVGTGQMVERSSMSVRGGDQEFAVVSNPEFLREGSAIEDFLHPDRVVVGAAHPARH